MVVYAKDRQDLGYLPSDGETLKAYCSRLREVERQNRYAYAPKHETWYEHTKPASCFICNFMDMTDYLIGCIEDMLKQDIHGKWTCHRPEGSKDPLTFVFTRVKTQK